MRLRMAAVSLRERFLNVPRFGFTSVGLIEADLQLATKGLAKKAASLRLLDKKVDLMRLVVLDFDHSLRPCLQGRTHFVGKLG